MNDIKDYWEKELKYYVIGNMLMLLLYYGKLQKKWLYVALKILIILVESDRIGTVFFCFVYLGVCFRFSNFRGNEI